MWVSPLCITILCININLRVWLLTRLQGAFWGLVVGISAGVTRFALDFAYPEPRCWEGGQDTRPSLVRNFHYLYFAIFLFLLTLLVTVAVSLITKPIPDHNVSLICIAIDYMRKANLGLYLLNFHVHLYQNYYYIHYNDYINVIIFLISKWDFHQDLWC